MRYSKTKGVLAGLVVVAFAGLLLLRSDQGQAVVLARSQSVPPQAGCSVATLRGTYGNAYQDLWVNYPVGLAFAEGFTPVAGLGIVTFDGRGNFTAHSTTSLGGVVVEGSYSGPYTVSSDCTGMMVLNFEVGDPASLKIVIVDSAKQIHTLGITPGHIAPGIMKKL